MLFMNKIDLEITESVRCWVKHALGPQKKPVEGKVTGQWSDRSSETGTHTSISDLFKWFIALNDWPQ